MTWLGALVIGLWGCAGAPPSADEPPPRDTGMTGDDDDTVVPPGDDEGSVVVVVSEPSLYDPDGSTLFTGMFVETRQGWINLAQCVGEADSFCAGAWPTVPDDHALVQDFTGAVLSGLDTKQVGDTVSLGPWSAPYARDDGSGLGFYFASFTTTNLPDYAVDLHLPDDGGWGGYDGGGIRPPTPIELTSFDPMVAADFHDEEPIRIAWTAEGGETGQVYLLVETAPEDRLYLLEDDGEFDLDLSALGLSDGSPIEMVLGRWSTATLDLDGNLVEVAIQSNQRLSGAWSDIGPRTELTDLYDTCAEAELAAPVPPGNYTGDFSAFGNHLNPGVGGCTGYPATGSDAIVPIEIQPEALLEVSYKLVSDDASVYLLADCDVVATCVEGADRTLVGGTETVSFFNDTGAVIRGYLVLDAFDDATDEFDLDITITGLGGDLFVPTCLEAIDLGPVTGGEYHGSLGGNADYLDPVCAGGAAGGEGLAQIYLEAGQTLTADVTAPGVDVKLYLLSNCSIADSCFFVADAEGGSHEELVYTNAGPSSAYLYLVLDGDLNVGEYFLDLAIQ